MFSKKGKIWSLNCAIYWYVDNYMYMLFLYNQKQKCIWKRNIYHLCLLKQIPDIRGKAYLILLCPVRNGMTIMRMRWHWTAGRWTAALLLHPGGSVCVKLTTHGVRWTNWQIWFRVLKKKFIIKLVSFSLPILEMKINMKQNVRQ